MKTPSSPVKPAAAPVDPYENVPVARPVPPGYIPPDSPPDEDVQSFLLSAFRLGIFHFFNAVLSVFAFVLVVVGSVFSVAMLPLCCFGIVTFRFLLFLVGFLAELDVSLYNYISPPDEHVYLSMPRQSSNFFEFSGLRIAPNLSSFSPGALLVSVYFASVKFVVGLLSNIALSVAFSFPISAFTDKSIQQTFFSDFLGVLGFLIFTTLLLVVGSALMKFAATLSRSATRYFCCEKFSTYQYVNRPNSYPTAVPTYGTTTSSLSPPRGDRVVV